MSERKAIQSNFWARKEICGMLLRNPAVAISFASSIRFLSTFQHCFLLFTESWLFPDRERPFPCDKGDSYQCSPLCAFQEERFWLRGSDGPHIAYVHHLHRSWWAGDMGYHDWQSTAVHGTLFPVCSALTLPPKCASQSPSFSWESLYRQPPGWSHTHTHSLSSWK